MADNWWDDLLEKKDEIGGALGGLLPGSRSTSAEPFGPPVPQDVLDYNKAYEKARKEAQQKDIERRAAKEFETDEDRAAATRFSEEKAAEIRNANATAAVNEARVKELQAKLEESQDPRQSQLIDIQLSAAQASLNKTLADIERIKHEMPQREQIILTDMLAREREQIRQEWESRKSDADFERTMALEGIRFGQQLELDERRGQRDILRDSMSIGVQTRAQELQRLKAQDEFTINMLQNQIAAGRLSMDKAAKVFEAYVTKARLPSEIMANVARAAEPFLPYMTTAKTGDIPLGFERGGSMDVIQRLGGNAPSAYDPSKYAVKASPMPFDLAKAAKAPKLPDPKSLFGGVPDIKVPTGGTSATAGLPGVGDFVAQTQAQQAAIGLGPKPSAPNLVSNAMPAPPGAGTLTDEERQQLAAALK